MMLTVLLGIIMQNYQWEGLIFQYAWDYSNILGDSAEWGVESKNGLAYYEKQ